MADGLGRWLGVKGDEEELMFRQHQYQHTKATETLRKNRGLTSGQAANLDAIDSDSDVDDDFDPDKAGAFHASPSCLSNTLASRL